MRQRSWGEPQRRTERPHSTGQGKERQTNSPQTMHRTRLPVSICRPNNSVAEPLSPRLRAALACLCFAPFIGGRSAAHSPAEIGNPAALAGSAPSAGAPSSFCQGAIVDPCWPCAKDSVRTEMENIAAAKTKGEKERMIAHGLGHTDNPRSKPGNRVRATDWRLAAVAVIFGSLDVVLGPWSFVCFDDPLFSRAGEWAGACRPVSCNVSYSVRHTVASCLFSGVSSVLVC